MTYAPSAPSEIWAAQEIDAGTKISVMAMWSWADHEIQQAIESTTVYAKMLPDHTPVESLIAKLAEQTGAKPRAIREHLTKAKAEGFAEINGLAVTLHWPPRKPEQRHHVKIRRDNVEPVRDSVNATAASDDVIASADDATTSDFNAATSENDVIASSQLTPPSPHVPKDPPLSPSPKPRRRAQPDPSQPTLPIPGTSPPASPAAKPPDPAQLVADRLRQRQTETRAALGMPKPGTSVLDAKRRGRINARITTYGLEACFRVIDVDAAECRDQGPEGKSWGYWNLDTPFSDAANFERRLNRWREDGNHKVWGVESSRTDHRSRGSSMPGQNERLAEAADRDNAERERMEAELQAHLAKIRGPNYVPPPRVDEDEECTF
jgi:hypothetical protein